jgi:hypothetical protein
LGLRISQPQLDAAHVEQPRAGGVSAALPQPNIQLAWRRRDRAACSGTESFLTTVGYDNSGMISVIRQIFNLMG